MDNEAEAAETATDEGAGTATDTASEATTQTQGVPTQTDTTTTGDDGQQELTDPSGPDGAAPGWSDLVAGIQDEKVRNALGSTDSLESAGRDLVRMKEEISSRIKVPGKDAPAEEVAKFRKAIGAGETPEAYQNVPYPEGYTPNDLDKQMVENMSQIAYDNGVPLEAFQGLAKDYFDIADRIEQAKAEKIEQHQKELEKQLQTEWGPDTERNKNAADYAVQHLGDENFRAVMNTPMDGLGILVGDHPAVIKVMAQIGLSMKEGGAPFGMSEGAKQTIQDELNELYKKIGTPEYHDPKIQARVRELNEKLHGTEPISNQ